MAILDFKVKMRSQLKNNASNGFLVINLLKKVYLHMFVGGFVKKLVFTDHAWRPPLILCITANRGLPQLVCGGF